MTPRRPFDSGWWGQKYEMACGSENWSFSCAVLLRLSHTSVVSEWRFSSCQLFDMARICPPCAFRVLEFLPRVRHGVRSTSLMLHGERLPEQRPEIWVGTVASLRRCFHIRVWLTSEVFPMRLSLTTVSLLSGVDAVTYDETRAIQYTKLVGAAHCESSRTSPST